MTPKPSPSAPTVMECHRFDLSGVIFVKERPFLIAYVDRGVDVRG